MTATYNNPVGGAEQNPERLRDLALQRAEGHLTHDDFRARRREFINAVQSGEKSMYPGSVPTTTGRRRGGPKHDTVNLPILVVTACIIALLTLGSLYLIRDKGSPYANIDTEAVAEE